MNFKRMLSLVLALMMVCTVLSACNPDNGDSSVDMGGNANYKVTILAPDGTPMTTGVVVKFMQEGVQKAMQTVDAGGTAAKELPKGDYTVELMFTVDGMSYGYDKTNVQLTATKTELTVDLLNEATEKGPDLSVKTGKVDEYGFAIHADYASYVVSTGRTVVNLAANDKNFFLYMPEKKGYYEITVENNVGIIAYNGSPYAVQDVNLAEKVEGKENTILLTVQSGSEGGEHVLSIENAGDATQAILNIKWVGEINEIPWTNYSNVSELKPYAHPAGAAVTDFDLTKQYEIVFNEADGYYHVGTKDGPVVLVRLGANADTNCKYLLKSWETVASTDYVVAYHYDRNGEVIERINYGPAILQYFEVDDEASGLYPMTKDLYTIIRDVGESKGWWDKTRPYLNIFADPESDASYPFTEETAWLFNCCYIEG